MMWYMYYNVILVLGMFKTQKKTQKQWDHSGIVCGSAYIYKCNNINHFVSFVQWNSLIVSYLLYLLFFYYKLTIIYVSVSMM